MKATILRSYRGFTKASLTAIAVALAFLAVRGLAKPPVAERTAFIVQARDMAAAAAAVRSVGGKITHELGIIDAVGGSLTPAQAADLRARANIVMFADGLARTAGTQQSWAPNLVGADRLYNEGVTGAGVTIAVLDTGAWPMSALKSDPAGKTRLLQGYDAINNTLGTSATNDTSGHGTHVASIAVNSDLGPSGFLNGIAPKASLVVVRAFDLNGQGTYANVIRGIDWVVANKTKYNIRVLNCSFSAPVRSWYWQDPLNQAIMKAWKAGIVVVASAGNGGPNPMTIGVPGNVPYVITVGAMTDRYTPSDGTDDKLASFSAAGPTFEGFAKPDVVAPGGHLSGIMDKNRTIPLRIRSSTTATSTS